jgi:hypothetical protein
MGIIDAAGDDVLAWIGDRLASQADPHAIPKGAAPTHGADDVSMQGGLKPEGQRTSRTQDTTFSPAAKRPRTVTSPSMVERQQRKWRVASR